MKVSPNFNLREFVPKETYEKWGNRSIWFIDQRLFSVAELYKSLFLKEFKKLYPDVIDVLIIVNNWHVGGPYNFRGYRPPNCTEGAGESQHRFGRGFDCDVIIVFKNGIKKEAEYALVHKIIRDNWDQLNRAGLTTVEDVSIAATWLHSDTRNTGIETLLIVKP